MTLEVISPDSGQVPAEERSWDDNYGESSFGEDGKKGSWQDWGQIMRMAINPHLGCLEDVLRRAPAPRGADQAEVDILWKLMLEQINAPCSHYNLELRLLQAEGQMIQEVLDRLDEEWADDDYLRLDPAEWDDRRALLSRIPLTRGGCNVRVGAIRLRVEDLHSLIETARRGGVYYDVCGLTDWFATPPEQRTTSTPSQQLPYFGQVLFGILGLNAQNTYWGHIEAVTSRQLAPMFGGSYDENEKTRHRDRGGQGGGGSTAPGA